MSNSQLLSKDGFGVRQDFEPEGSVRFSEMSLDAKGQSLSSASGSIPAQGATATQGADHSATAAIAAERKASFTVGVGGKVSEGKVQPLQGSVATTPEADSLSDFIAPTPGRNVSTSSMGVQSNGRAELPVRKDAGVAGDTARNVRESVVQKVAVEAKSDPGVSWNQFHSGVGKQGVQTGIENLMDQKV